MRKQVLLFGLLGGVMVVVLRLIEYRWLVVEHSLEIYGGLVAAVFAGVGLWLGQRLTRRPNHSVPSMFEVAAPEASAPEVVVHEVAVRQIVVPTPGPFVRDLSAVERLGLTPRELEMLELVAEGLSNREIAERVFVSENTVKTHLSRVFDKLGARRRTQAVQLGKASGLIP